MGTSLPRGRQCDRGRKKVDHTHVMWPCRQRFRENMSFFKVQNEWNRLSIFSKARCLCVVYRMGMHSRKMPMMAFVSYQDGLHSDIPAGSLHTSSTFHHLGLSLSLRIHHCGPCSSLVYDGSRSKWHGSQPSSRAPRANPNGDRLCQRGTVLELELFAFSVAV